MEKLRQTDGGGVDFEKWVVSGVSVSLRSPSIPVFTEPLRMQEDDDEELSTTPTSAESRIPSKLACPPAPKKPKPSSLRSCHYAGVREFFNPPDLETIFLRRK